MNILIDLIKNPVFLSAGGAWLVAQVSKVIYESIRYGFKAERLTGGGGMPSSHSATMIGLTVGCLLTHSAASPEFAIAVFLSMVVMYDDGTHTQRSNRRRDHRNSGCGHHVHMDRSADPECPLIDFKSTMCDTLLNRFSRPKAI